MPFMKTGLRQNHAARYLSDGVEDTFVIDQEFLVERIKLMKHDWSDFTANDTVRIQIENEVLFGGQAVPIVAVMKPLNHSDTDHSKGPYCLQFDTPFGWDQRMPITITVAGDDMWLIIEGPQGGEV